MIFIGIGSNLGDRLSNIRWAVELMQSRCLHQTQSSIILETQAILPIDAPPEWNKKYLNMVICGETNLSSHEMLHELKSIEYEIGRFVGYEKWSPRVIDLDILLWHQDVIHTPELRIPHQHLLDRHFLIHLIALLQPYYCYPKTSSLYDEKTFGEIAHGIDEINGSFVRGFVLYPQFVGVINITPDSFSDGGLYIHEVPALDKVLQLINDGASIIELGPQSTRPNVTMLNHEEEYARLEPVLDRLSYHMQNQDIQVSIDTFWPDTVLKVLKHYKISFVNDVKGDLDERTLEIIADSGCKIVVMHSLTIPPNRYTRIDDNVTAISPIYTWAEKTMDKLLKCGFKKEDIVIDPGIGFGKSTYQNIQLLRDAHELKELGCKTMVGHSRKGYINGFYQSLVPRERDLETIAVSQALYDLGIDYLRVHNVADHQRFFVAQEVAKNHGYLKSK